MIGQSLSVSGHSKIDLKKILSFRNSDIVERYQDEFGMGPDEANQLFQDVLLFLYICATSEPGEEITPTQPIDNGWHQFLMFTREYQHFCKEYVGRFVHHVPFTRKDKKGGRGLKKVIARNRAEALVGELSTNWDAVNGDCGKCKSCSGDCCPLYD